MATWRPIETYAPFARELATYMWEARPPLNPNQFADRVGIRRQLLSNWLNSPPDARIAPEPAVLLRLARVMGRPVSELFVLVGHTTADDPLLDRADAWAYVTGEVERALADDGADEGEGTEEGATAVLALLRRLRERDEVTIARLHALDRTLEDGESGDGPGDDAAPVSDPAVAAVPSESA